MKAIAWKDVPVGSFITTTCNLRIPATSRDVWEKIKVEGCDCEHIKNKIKHRINDQEWECYLCDSEGNLIEEKTVTHKTIKFEDIKIGEYFSKEGNAIVWQKINPHGKNVNAILTKWDSGKCPLGDLPMAVYVDKNPLDEYYICDKYGVELKDIRPFYKIKVEEFFQIGDNIYMKTQNSKSTFGNCVCVVSMVKDLPAPYCTSVTDWQSYEIVNKPDNLPF